jgi:sugar/nucleoside kinase (ribokinase family)
MKKVLMFGDVNVDIMMGGLESLPVPDRETICETYELTVGSSAAICACNYASLGGDVSILGLTGRDENGDFMLREMQSYGINVEHVQRTSEVGTGVTVNLTHGSNRTQITYPGTIAEFDGSSVDRSVVNQFDHLHFAGPYLQTKFRPHITRLLDLASEAGISTSLDPQWDVTEGWEFMDEWLPRLTYLFLNRDEALSMSKTALPEAAIRWLGAKTACPLVKLGSQGVMIRVGTDVKIVPSYSVEVVDTTGAGDAFDAGFLLSVLDQGLEFEEAVRFANATAARSCTFIGGVNARSSVADVVAFLEAQE